MVTSILQTIRGTHANRRATVEIPRASRELKVVRQGHGPRSVDGDTKSAGGQPTSDSVPRQTTDGMRPPRTAGSSVSEHGKGSGAPPLSTGEGGKSSATKHGEKKASTVTNHGKRKMSTTTELRKKGSFATKHGEKKGEHFYQSWEKGVQRHSLRTEENTRKARNAAQYGRTVHPH